MTEKARILLKMRAFLRCFLENYCKILNFTALVFYVVFYILLFKYTYYAHLFT